MALQENVNDIDVGITARFLKIGMLSLALVGLCVLYFLNQFKGLGTEHAMDQAQIARSLISGKGFSTRYIRPLAIRQLSDSGKNIPSGNFPEFYNAPLFPIVEAAALLPVKNRLQMAPTDLLCMGDRAIALLGIVLLLLSVFVWYFVGRLLFDAPLAIIASGLLLATDLIWQYALSGLPQLFLIFLFGPVTFCSLKAKQADEHEETVPTLLWLAAAAFGLGLMSLTHGIASFLVPGFLVFCLFGFQSRIMAFVISMVVYLITVFPWLIHNYLVCGNPFGISIYMAMAGAGITENEVMRGVNIGLSLGAGMAAKFRNGLVDQAAHLWEYLGLNIIAPAFLLSLLYPFRNPTAALWRWIVLLMWGGAAIGMTLFGVKESVSANQLHLIFLPIFILYGMAFVLVLWNRLNINFKPLRTAFLSIIFLLAGTPMLLTLLAGPQGRIQWPPYVPVFISVFNKWFSPGELLSSDVPAAVAWYADRKCLLLPETVRQFDEISDFGTLGTPIVGLYLTPVSAKESFLDLIKGPYKEWGPVIMRTVDLNNFLLKSYTPLPVDGECLLYADNERWRAKPKEDK